jgi:hypothetical protein
MKKSPLIHILVWGASALITLNSFSQLGASSLSKNEQFTVRVNAADADKMALAGLKAANLKAFNHFSRHFKTASAIHVSAVADQTQIDFEVDSICNSVRYSSEGKWMFSLRWYDQSKLDNHIRSLVETSYAGYFASGYVAELKVFNNTAFLVMIENQDSWKRIRVVNGAAEIYEEYNKQ